jgi:hypothetical protein
VSAVDRQVGGLSAFEDSSGVNADLTIDSGEAGAVNIWRGEVAASVTGDVGIAEVVGKNKDDVRREWPALATVVTRSGRISRARLWAISLRGVTRSGRIS